MLVTLFRTPSDLRGVNCTVIAMLLAAALSMSSYAAEPAPRELPPQVAKKAAMQARFVQQQWKGQGHVVIGKLDIPPEIDPGQIASRTILLKDGWFAARLYTGRTLTFRAHGFRSVDIQPPDHAPLLFDAGTIKLEPIDNDKLTTVRGVANFPQLSTGKRIRVSLHIDQPPQIFADDAYEGGSMRPVVDELYMPAGEEFYFKKMSTFAYRLQISAPHYIVRDVPLPADRSQNFDVGKITLVACPKLVFNYVSQFRGAPPAEVQTKSVECDDHNTFIFTKLRDELGNRLFLRLHPDDGKVVARFWFFPSGFYDVGKGQLKNEIASFSLDRVTSSPFASEQTLEDGHVYYFECPEKKANCLFRVSVAGH